MKTVLGILLALAIGAGCRWFHIPIPAPPTLIGAVLVLAVTIGYLGMDRLLGRQDDGPQPQLPAGPQDAVSSPPHPATGAAPPQRTNPSAADHRGSQGQ